MKGHILETDSATKEGRRAEEALKRLAGTPEGRAFLEWIAEEHGRLCHDSSINANDIGLRWGQGAAQALEDILKFSNT